MMDYDEFQKCGEEMLHYVTSYHQNIRMRRAQPDVEPGFMRSLIPEHAPMEPDSWDNVIKDIERVIMPGVTHWLSPKFFAYFPTSSSYESMLADILCNAIGCIGFTWASCPSCTELEVLMIDWLGQLLNLPDEFLHNGPGNGGGVIQGTASEAIVVCLLAARTLFYRQAKEKDANLTIGQMVDKLVAYSSDQSHSSVEKAGLIGAVRMRKLKTDDRGSLRSPELNAAITEDKRNGLIPFFLCATAGTTATCAFDNLKELGTLCKRHQIWMHIDAAYAGSAFICPEFRSLLDGVEYATSFNFNPHKWLRVMFDCSALWVRNTDYLRYAFDVDPLYLKHENEMGVMPDFRHWQIPLGRRFRSLKIWFVLRLFGQKKLQDGIRKDVSLAHHFEHLVTSDKRFELCADVILGLVCFRLKGLNKLTEKLIKSINAAGKIHLTPSKMKGSFFIRFAICSPDSQVADVDYAWEVIRTNADFLLTEDKQI